MPEQVTVCLYKHCNAPQRWVKLLPKLLEGNISAKENFASWSLNVNIHCRDTNLMATARLMVTSFLIFFFFCGFTE